ncbi:hypothetical protein QBC42DRAFT_253787 [Cladorrhinum samala]|uniref:Uncharacterized protein n=1 Tax=Cladorrhinum samala TaxID=585594 RepID=A0AAV9HHT1_9PEZI|nr:hypothetical protein QBC42DRAFT_253787 [Cladorrhinum samala]
MSSPINLHRPPPNQPLDLPPSISDMANAIASSPQLPDGDDEPTQLAPSPRDDDATPYIFNLDKYDGTVVWQDSDQQNSSLNLKVSLHVNCTQNVAILILVSGVFLKHKNNEHKLPLYLHIFPENIRSIGYHARAPLPIQPSPDVPHIGLHFSLHREPAFIVPPKISLNAKAQDESLLDGMTALASLKDFTVYLPLLNLAIEKREQLALLPSIFDNHELKTDERRASVKRLYRGEGGQVVNLKELASSSRNPGPGDKGTAEETLPRYTEKDQSPTQVAAPPNTKRPRTPKSTPPSPSDREEKRLKLESRVELLEKAAQAPRTPCRYNSQERNTLEDDIEDRLREMVRSEYEDRLMGIEDTVIGSAQGILEYLAEDAQDQAMTYIRELVPRAVKRQVEQMFEDVVERVVERVTEQVLERVVDEVRKDIAQRLA